MFLKLKIIDRFSLKPVRDCEVSVICQENTFKHLSDGEIIIGLPKYPSDCSLKVSAPMYKGIEYNIEGIEDNNELIIDLDFVELFDEEPITA